MDESLVKNHVIASKRKKRLISNFITIEKIFLKLKWDTHRQKFIPDAYNFFLFWEGKQAVNIIVNDQAVGMDKQLFCWPNIARIR